MSILPITYAPEVRAALDAGHPVVALESTIITHGMPFPQNVEAARAVEAEVRAHGAVPATIAVMGGQILIGLSDRSRLMRPMIGASVAARTALRLSRPSMRRPRPPEASAARATATRDPQRSTKPVLLLLDDATRMNLSGRAVRAHDSARGAKR